jgi:hypothetical protein
VGLHASARVEGPDGRIVEVHAGDLLGRSARSVLRLDDPRVSEAHGWVSLRGGTLKLLALRGVLTVDGRAVEEVELAVGLIAHLAPGVALHVLDVSLPSRVMALQIGRGEPAPLLGSVQSVGGQPLRVRAGYDEHAALHVWCTEDQWLVQQPGEPAAPIAPGLRFGIDGTVLRFFELELRRAGARTTMDRGKLHPTLHLVVRYHSVHVHRHGLPVVSLSGQPAMLVSELAALDGPVDWELVAKQVWRRFSNRDVLRKKLDSTLSRLRHKLAAEAIRSDLVRADGTGRLELVLYDGDRVDDLT